MNTNLKFAAIKFIVQFLNMAQHSALPYIEKLSSVVINAANDSFYKISTEALNALGLLVKVINPDSVLKMDLEFTEASKKVILDIYLCTWQILSIPDNDAEVKVEALRSLGIIVSHAGHLLPTTEFREKLTPFIIRSLKNETLKLTAVHMISAMAESQIIQDLQEFIDLSIFTTEIAMLLPKSQSRVATITCLESIMRNSNPPCDPQLNDSILTDLSAMLNSSDTDVHVLSKAFNLASVILQSDGGSKSSTINIFSTKFIPSLIEVIKVSPHLVAGGTGLDSLLKLWVQMTRFHERSRVYEVGVAGLLEFSKTANNKESFRIIAKCTGATVSGPIETIVSLIRQLVGYISNESVQENYAHISLLSLGELGKTLDMALHAPGIESLLLRCFESHIEDIKLSAAFCLGNIAVGNLAYYLP